MKEEKTTKFSIYCHLLFIQKFILTLDKTKSLIFISSVSIPFQTSSKLQALHIVNTSICCISLCYLTNLSEILDLLVSCSICRLSLKRFSERSCSKVKEFTFKGVAFCRYFINTEPHCW